MFFLNIHIRRLWQNNLGATATEYAFIVAFIAIVAAGGMIILGTNLSSFYTSIGSALSGLSCKMPDTASDNGSGNSNKCKNKSP